MKRSVKIKEGFSIGEGSPLTLMAGPCVIENETLCMQTAAALKEMCEARGIQYLFKASYDKANRSSIHSFRGVGIDEGLRILENVKRAFDVPIVTDVHSPEEARRVGQVCDVLQIPAFLCRQTDLLVAAAESGAVVSVKKGQFMAPWDMQHVINKIIESNNNKIILVERGATFGYNNLVSDMRSIPIMQQMGVPVCFDATHSVQLPGGLGETSGGQREFIGLLARAAIASGADCLFMEAHPTPDKAKSDAASQMNLQEMPALLDLLVRLYEVINDYSSKKT